MAADQVHRFVRFAWLTLGITIVVIVWGAVVRATGSGAGCGSHWPLCNGDVVPLAPAAATIIEFTHRLTSGLSLVMTVVLVIFGWRVYPSGHPVRRWAVWSLAFMLAEAVIGAGIVLLRLVEDNASALRAGYVALHLTNTMFLVAAMTGTIRFSGSQVLGSSGSRVRQVPCSIALLLMVVVAAAGAIVALGDTLFPASSLAQGVAADFDSTSHFLIRLRIWHPILAAFAAALAVWVFRTALITTLVAVQVALGLMNLFMLAPLPLQMAHLAGSNVLWIAMVWRWLDNTSHT